MKSNRKFHIVSIARGISKVGKAGRISTLAAIVIISALSSLAAQITPAPGWCSMAHCNPQMSDFVAQTPPGLDGNVYVKSSDLWNTGVAVGDGCVSNGTYAVCAYKQS